METLRISTADFPEKQRVEAFRETFGKRILKIEIEPQSHAGFSADMRLQAFPGLGIGVGALSSMQNRRPSSLIDDGGMVLVIMLAGTATARQFGRECTISAGQAILTANDAPATFTGHTPTKLINLRFDPKRLAIAEPKDLAVQPLSRGNAALQLLTSYVTLLGLPGSTPPANVAELAANHVYDLAALAFGTTRDEAEVARSRGVRAARLATALELIRSHFDDPTLSPTDVARRAGISNRYLHKLLHDTGSSFADRVQDLRLTKAFALLSGQSHAARRIHDVAYSAGFGDLSHFNRVFRRKFGMTPTAARERSPLD